MLLNIIDIASSMMRSVNKAVSTMSGITFREMPVVTNEPVPYFSVRGSKGTFISIMRFEQKDKKWTKGAIVIAISGEQIQKLFSKNYGITLGSPDDDIIDVCGEFCNVVAGGFKKELVVLGFGEQTIEVPENHYKELSKNLDLVIHNKYQLVFNHEGTELLLAEVAMESQE